VRALAAAPVRSPSTNSVDESAQITFQSSTAGAQILYSLNGGPYRNYTGPFSLTAGIYRITAYAIAEGHGASAVVESKLIVRGQRVSAGGLVLSPAKQSIHLSVEVPAASYYVVQVASDLQNWTDASDVLPGGTHQFDDGVIAGSSMRFYRLIEVDASSGKRLGFGQTRVVRQ